jgi:cytochrome P450
MLSAHPVVERRVRDEVDRVLEGREPRMEDVVRLEYTNAAVRETLRLYPPAWMFVRLAAEDDVIRGYRIPKGTAVMLSPYVMHRQSAFWPDPERFDPVRFVRDPTLGMGAVKNWAYMPFGGGSLRVLHPNRVRPRPAATLKVADDLPVRFIARRD